MIKSFFLLLSFLWLHSNLYAQDAFFRPTNSEFLEIKEGNSFKGTIEIQGLQNISPEMVSKMEGEDFLDYFHVVSLEEPTWSENNTDVVVIKGLFILSKSFSETESSALWSLGGLMIPTVLRGFKTEASDQRGQDYKMVKGQYDFQKSYPWYMYLVLAIIPVLAFVGLRRYKKNSSSIYIKSIDWKVLIDRASDQEEISYLYENKNKWRDLIKDEIAFKNFVQKSNTILFKKKADDIELKSLKNEMLLALKGTEI